MTSYYDNLPYPKSSLMTANQPWSGSYNVATPVWISGETSQKPIASAPVCFRYSLARECVKTCMKRCIRLFSAHFTQFSRVGWKYLPHGLGVGNFTHQGSYTSMTDGKDLSVFIVTMVSVVVLKEIMTGKRTLCFMWVLSR